MLKGVILGNTEIQRINVPVFLIQADQTLGQIDCKQIFYNIYAFMCWDRCFMSVLSHYVLYDTESRFIDPPIH